MSHKGQLETDRAASATIVAILNASDRGAPRSDPFLPPYH